MCWTCNTVGQSQGLCRFGVRHRAGATTIFRHFYADDATPEGLAARTLEFTRHATVIKLTPDPYFMTLSFGGSAECREHNDKRPALSAVPVAADGSWSDFQFSDEKHIQLVLETVRLLKASPEAAGKPLYVNVFAPFTVAMQCDPRLVERLSSAEERPVVAQGLHAIAESTAQYISRLADAGADGIFYSNKCLRAGLGDLVEEWVLPLDALALAPIRGASGSGRLMAVADVGGVEQEEQGDRAQSLDMVLHACGPEIVYDRIVSALEDPSVYPKDTSLSWNLGEGNPSIEKVLKTTSLRVWGTYPRALLSKAEGAEASVALESFLLKHRAWLEGEGYLHRVVIGPDCCPGAFSGEEVPARGWNAVHRAYARWMGGAPTARL